MSTDGIFAVLPSLKTKLNRDIPTHVSQKLNYQWKVLHKSSVNSSQFKLGISQSFMSTIEEFGVELPEFIAKKFCPFCSSFLSPSLTMQMRIRPVHKNSKLNRKRSEDMRSKNDLVLTCLTCNKVAYRVPAFGRAKNKMQLIQTEASAKPPDSNSCHKTGSSAEKKPQSSAKRFSFLDKLDTNKWSAPGKLDSNNFIAFTESEQKGIGHGLQSLLNKKTNKRSIDKVSMPSEGQQQHKRTPESNSDKAVAVTPGASTAIIDLDALERKNKKQKKKMSFGASSNFSATTTPSKPAASLNSLHSVFSNLSKK